MRTLERIESVVEYLLAALFTYGGVGILFAEPAALPGLWGLLVGQAAIYLYGAFFIVLGIVTAYAKIRKRRVMHKHSLLLMYLSSFYIISLAVAVNGLTPFPWFSLFIALLCAYLWLRWKLRTEYFNPKHVHELR